MQNAAALLDLANGVETGVTPRQALRAISAMLGGLISGATSGTVVVKAINNAGTTRLTIEADADGNRTSITLNI